MKIRELFESETQKAVADAMSSELNAAFSAQNIKARAEWVGSTLAPGRYFVKVNIDTSSRKNVDSAYKVMKDYLEDNFPEDNLMGIDYDLVLSAHDRYHIYLNQVE